jgi:hypothetical protein
MNLTKAPTYIYWVIKSTEGLQVIPDANDDGSYHLALKGTRFATADTAYSELSQLTLRDDDYLHIDRITSFFGGAQ